MYGDNDNVASLRSRLGGTYGNVDNISGETLQQETPFINGKDMEIFFGPSSDDDEEGFAQSTAYYWAIKGSQEFLYAFDYQQSQQLMLGGLQINANINDSFGCNAYWDGSSVNFFKSTKYCNNTATPSVIIHELGHGFDVQAGGIRDRGYSEGFGDVLAMLVLENPCSSPNFWKADYKKGPCFRDAREKHMWPPKEGEEHAVGQIYSAFVWQLIQQLKVSTGSEYRAYSIARQLVFYSAYFNPADIPNAVHKAAFVDYLVNEENKGKYYGEIVAAANSLNLPLPNAWWKKEDVNSSAPTQPPIAANPSPPAVEPTPEPAPGGTISIGGDIDEDDINNTSGGTTSIIQ